MTTPLIYKYSHSNIEKNMEFIPFCDSEMQYRIQYPKHWSVSIQNDSTFSKTIVFQPPQSESGIQEVLIVEKRRWSDA